MLDRPGSRWVISSLLPLLARKSKHGVRSLNYANGWVHQFDEAVVVEPEPRMRCQHISEESNQGIWGLLYTPRQGDVVVDVGAGLGSESLYYARKVASTGRVLAVEAHPIICDFLKRSIELSGFSHVTVMNLAVTDMQQTVMIENDLKHHLGNAIARDGTGVAIEGLPLDSICAMAGITHVDFLKMNIEGAERLALGGMENILLRTKFVCISCHDFKFRETGNEFFRTKELVENYMRRHGFKMVPRSNADREIADQVNAYNPALVQVAGD